MTTMRTSSISSARRVPPLEMSFSGPTKEVIGMLFLLEFRHFHWQFCCDHIFI